MKVTALFTALAMTAGSAAIAQTTWYVDPTGDDGNAGTQGSPFATIDHAIDQASNSDTIEVAVGTYNISSTIGVNKELTINGAQAGVSARDAVGARTAGDDTTESVLSSTAATVFSIVSDNVTIDGFSIEGTTLSNAIQGSGRDNVTIANNFLVRPSATPAAQVAAIRFDSGSSNISIRDNQTLHFGGHDPNAFGAITVVASTDSDVSWNEVIANPSTTDGRNGIHVTGSEITVAHNLITERYAKYPIYIRSFGADPGYIYVRDNTIDGYLQAGIGLRRPRVIIERNTFLPADINAGSLPNAGIYIRDANVQDVTIRNNHIADQNSTSSTSWGAIRPQNFVNGATSTFNMRGNNLYNNGVTHSSVFYSISFVHSNDNTMPAQTCTNAWELRNNWWGAATGPSSMVPHGGTYGSGAYQGARADACDGSFSTEVGGLGDTITTNDATNKEMRFYPWALFEGNFTYTETGGITLTAGTNRILGGDDGRYTKHSVEMDAISAPAYVTIFSPEERLTEPDVLAQNSAVAINALDAAGNPVSFPGNPAIVTVEYKDDDVPVGEDENRMRLHRWDGSDWVLVPDSTVDTVEQTVSGEVSTLSVFAALIAENTSPTLTITEPTVTRTRGSAPFSVDVATVTDVEDDDGDLTVAVLDNDGFLGSIIVNNNDGTVSADIEVTAVVDVTTYTITLQVTDSEGATDEGTFDLVVLPEPEVTITEPTVNGTQGAVTVTDVATVNDAVDDAGDLSVAVTFDDDFGGSITLVNNAGTVTATITIPCTADADTYTIVWAATNSEGAANDGTFDLVVDPNPAPTIGTYSNLSVEQDASDTATPSAPPADANDNIDTVTVAPETLPGGGTVSVDPITGVVTITTTAATEPNDYTITVTVTDECGAFATSSFTLTVPAPPTGVDAWMQLDD